MPASELPSDVRRSMWVLGLLVLGWVLLALCLSNLITQMVHGLLLSDPVFVLSPWLKGCTVAWAGLSVLSNVCWFCAWGEDYHRIVIHCAYLDERTNADGLDGFVANIGSLPGYLLGVCLTD